MISAKIVPLVSVSVTETKLNITESEQIILYLISRIQKNKLKIRLTVHIGKLKMGLDLYLKILFQYLK